MKKFVTTGPYEGKTVVINDRYSFVDGEMTCSDEIGELVKPILCGFYACKVVDVPNSAAEYEETDEEDEPSLSKESTKAGR